VKFNESIYVGICILDISKTCLYEFHHDYMSPLYRDKCKIMYTDTVLSLANKKTRFNENNGTIMTEFVGLRAKMYASTARKMNGRQFVAKAVKRTFAAFRIKAKTTPAYAPHCNPVERANKTIKTMVAQYVDKNHRHWDRHIPALQFAYNTAKHDSNEDPSHPR